MGHHRAPFPSLYPVSWEVVALVMGVSTTTEKLFRRVFMIMRFVLNLTDNWKTI